MAWIQLIVQKLALEAEKKSPARNKMSKVSRNVQLATGMLITTEECRKMDKMYQVSWASRITKIGKKGMK
jgi:hypothetical protein